MLAFYCKKVAELEEERLYRLTITSFTDGLINILKSIATNRIYKNKILNLLMTRLQNQHLL